MIKINKKQLFLFDAVIWFIAGLILLLRAYNWIELLSDYQLFIGLIVAIILGFVKTHFIFIKLTKKNIKRINNFTDKMISIYEFHSLKDKILIVIMIFGGSLLRQSSIPKFILMPIYIGIGFSMIYVSYMYLRIYVLSKKL
jgi:hypothetical protein